MGEVVLSVPDTEVVLVEDVLALHDDITAAVRHARLNGTPLTDEAVLSLHLMRERESSSDHTATFPKLQPSTVHMDKEVRGLLPRCYAHLAERSREHAVSQHKACADAFNAVGKPEPSLDAFLTAFVHLRARSFEANVYGGEPLERQSRLVKTVGGTRRALAPLIDMLNHDAGALSVVVRDGGYWRVVSQKAYTAGEQVFISYGNQSNLDFLLKNGFALEDNQEDVLYFDFHDVLDGCAAAQPHVFDGEVKDELLQKMAPSDSVSGGRVFHVTVHDLVGQGGYSQELHGILHVLQQIVTTFGGTEEEAKDLPMKAIREMLHSRLKDVELGLQESSRPGLESSLNEGGMLGAVIALLRAEQRSIKRLMGRREYE